MTTLGTSFELSASAACDELVGLKLTRAEPKRRDIKLLAGPKTLFMLNIKCNFKSSTEHILSQQD